MKKLLNSWAAAFAVYAQPRVLAMLFLGFAAGLPLLLVFSTLTAWLVDVGVSRTTIGFFAWVGITYSIKVFWSPIVDTMPLPGLTALLGKRRSWIFIGQLGIVVGIVAMTQVDPSKQLVLLAVCAVCVAFFSATQDIALDAYRIEAVATEYQGAMSATYVLGYRLAMLVAGGGALLLAEPKNWLALTGLTISNAEAWQYAYWIMAGLMSVGMITVLLIQEPDPQQDTDSAPSGNTPGAVESLWRRFCSWFVVAVADPFVNFFKGHGRFAFVLLLFIGCYRISDITMGVMANPFYLDLGFSKNEIGTIVKAYGFVMTLLGAFTGGIMVVRFGVFRPLLVGAIMVAATNVLFAQLAVVGADVDWLALVISADNFSGGFANAAFIAFLSGLVNRAYTATQYALFSSFMTLPGKFISGFSGMVVESSNYYSFFLYAALMGIPAIILSVIVMRHPKARQFIHSNE